MQNHEACDLYQCDGPRPQEDVDEPDENISK